MGKLEKLYEGKAKKIYATENQEEVIIYYKDDATAFNGEKKEQIENKGILNNAITSMIYGMLNKEGIPTHFIEKLNDTKVKQKNFEPTQGWSSYITFSDENGVSHKLEVCKDRIQYDYVWYAVKKHNSALYNYVKTLENKYFH
mgnify:CR=1 FL=1